MSECHFRNSLRAMQYTAVITPWLVGWGVELGRERAYYGLLHQKGNERETAGRFRVSIYLAR